MDELKNRNGGVVFPRVASGRFTPCLGLSPIISGCEYTR